MGHGGSQRAGMEEGMREDGPQGGALAAASAVQSPIFSTPSAPAKHADDEFLEFLDATLGDGEFLSPEASSWKSFEI
ncbi:hypothetical protein CYMTET_49408 [Cymbomonas tetramitiformis]|uniref:Uncharacterized protein n=1 Tax=Cymbomonas tetramitiformis TaxID=36881 RepID=A0AAE0BQ92_9CHLO|nr:hypothetical protein CYMTET_49408 [Cymbomonas tetramitiformis]